MPRRVFRILHASHSDESGLTEKATALAVEPRSGTVFAGTADGVFRSPDGGESWTAMNAGLANLAVTSLAIDTAAGVLYAGTEAGVFTSRLPRTTRPLPPR
jgi:ligand-binding sensor domain-containing protein